MANHGRVAESKCPTTATKRRTETQLTTNSGESCTGGLRNVAGHQAERADVLLPVEARKFHMNTIADVRRQYEHCDAKLGDRNKHVAEHVSVIRRGKKSQRLHSDAHGSDPIRS